MHSPPPRVVTLVLCTPTGEVFGQLPPFQASLPWWQEAQDQHRLAKVGLALPTVGPEANGASPRQWPTTRSGSSTPAPGTPPPGTRVAACLAASLRLQRGHYCPRQAAVTGSPRPDAEPAIPHPRKRMASSPHTGRHRRPPSCALEPVLDVGDLHPGPQARPADPEVRGDRAEVLPGAHRCPAIATTSSQTSSGYGLGPRQHRPTAHLGTTHQMQPYPCSAYRRRCLSQALNPPVTKDTCTVTARRLASLSDGSRLNPWCRKCAQIRQGTDEVDTFGLWTPGPQPARNGVAGWTLARRRTVDCLLTEADHAWHGRTSLQGTSGVSTSHQAWLTSRASRKA